MWPNIIIDALLFHRAFTSEENKSQLSYLFGLFFEHIFAAKKSTSLQSFQLCPSVTLPVNLKV